MKYRILKYSKGDSEYYRVQAFFNCGLFGWWYTKADPFKETYSYCWDAHIYTYDLPSLEYAEKVVKIFQLGDRTTIKQIVKTYE